MNIGDFFIGKTPTNSLAIGIVVAGKDGPVVLYWEVQKATIPDGTKTAFRHIEDLD